MGVGDILAWIVAWPVMLFSDDKGVMNFGAMILVGLVPAGLFVFASSVYLSAKNIPLSDAPWVLFGLLVPFTWWVVWIATVGALPAVALWFAGQKLGGVFAKRRCTVERVKAKVEGRMFGQEKLRHVYWGDAAKTKIFIHFEGGECLLLKMADVKKDFFAK